MRFPGMACGVSFSHCLSAGNFLRCRRGDLVSYLADDPGCKAITCLFEGVAVPGRMFEAAELAWKADKPLVIYKIASGEGGACSSNVAYRIAVGIGWQHTALLSHERVHRGR